MINVNFELYSLNVKSETQVWHSKRFCKQFIYGLCIETGNMLNDKNKVAEDIKSYKRILNYLALKYVGVEST